MYVVIVISKTVAHLMIFLQEDLDETGPTAPQDLWLSKTLDGSIWYLQSPPDEPPVEIDQSAPQTRYAVSQIYISKGEMVRRVLCISVLNSTD